MKIYYLKTPMERFNEFKRDIQDSGFCEVIKPPVKLRKGDMLILANGVLNSPDRTDTLELMAVEKIKRGIKIIGWRMEEVNCENFR